MGRLSSDFPNAQSVDAALKRANKAEVDVANLTTAMVGKVDYSDYQTETQNLQGQINQIVISSAAEAVVAPEVAQARVAADGTTHTTLKQRLDYEMQINSQNSENILNYIAEIDGRKRFEPSDYEQGGISTEGIETQSDNFIRTITYVPSNLSTVYIPSGAVYVKVYKNGAFIGNYNPNGTISTTSHSPWTDSVDLSNVYTIDSDYRVRFVYTKSTTTTPTDITKLYSTEDSELSALDQTIIKRRNINPADYEYTLAKVKNQGEYTIRQNENWIDFPDGFSTSTFIIMFVYDYHSDYSLQTVYSSDLKRTARRIIRHSGVAYSEWLLDDAYLDTGEPESEDIVPADYEQGGINSAGTNVESNNYIRSKSYISSKLNLLIPKTGSVYVKIYKNDEFVGNLEPDGSITHTDRHTPLTGSIELASIYSLDPDYRIRIVYTTGSETVVNDIVNVKGYNTADSVFSGVKISIYGDSISTYAGYIPEENRVYYTGSNAGVSSVTETWWYETITALNAELYINNSWSGRCVSNKRDQESEMIDSGAWRQSEVDKLSEGGVSPDIIIVKLGINDFNNRVQKGSYDARTALPEVTEEGPSTFRESYAIMLDRLMTTYPLAKIYCCTLNQCERSGSVGFPEINGNGDAISEFNDAIKELSAAFGAEIIDHSASGMTYYNLSTYAGDYSSSTGQGLHPNRKGMALLSNASIKAIDPSSKIRF